MPSQRHFALGLAAGLAWGIGRAYWLTETLQLYGALSFAEALATTALLILYMALYLAVFVAAVRRGGRCSVDPHVHDQLSQKLD